jgi:hypothetical protein
MSDEKSAPSSQAGDEEKGPLHHVSSRSVDVETAEMALFEDAKFDKKLLLKKDLVLVPLLGVMYMIMVSPQIYRMLSSSTASIFADLLAASSWIERTLLMRELPASQQA